MTNDQTSNLVSGLTKLGNSEGESWVTLREAEAAAVCAELSKLHAEHLQDVDRMDRAATAMEAYQAEIARLTSVETPAPRVNARALIEKLHGYVTGVMDRKGYATTLQEIERLLARCEHGATTEEACPECVGAPSDNPDDEIGAVKTSAPAPAGRPVKPHRSGGGMPPAPGPEAPIEVLPRPPTEGDGYKDAFYQIAELLDMTAMPISPKEAFETVMLPRLRELVSKEGGAAR